MRSTEEALKLLEVTVTQYIEELDHFSMDELLYTNNEDEWSIGQMYLHLIQSALFMQLANIRECLTGSEAARLHIGDKTEQGKAVFEQGSFPPIRISVPASPAYTPSQPESKEQLITVLHKVMNKLKEIEPEVSQSSEQYQIPHPSFGPLNAQEWFLLIEMHYRHHLLQLARLKEQLAEIK
ncbi:DinB superfamily protein [compost metagenome]